MPWKINIFFPPRLLSRKHMYFSDITLQQRVQRRYSELWWQVHPFLPPFCHLPQHSSNKQWHHFCNIFTKRKCFQLRHCSPFGQVIFLSLPWQVSVDICCCYSPEYSFTERLYRIQTTNVHPGCISLFFSNLSKIMRESDQASRCKPPSYLLLLKAIAAAKF